MSSVVCVGDLIQYRYSYGPKGFTQWALTMRAVIEIADAGAAFVVEGGFHVPARCIVTHIPMHGESADGEQCAVGSSDEFESADKLL